MAKKVLTKKPAAKRSDDALLDRWQQHRAMAQKHNAHAELIEAKLKTQGKRIDRYGDYPMSSAKAAQSKPKIVPDR